ncbi:MAG TPA: hypothetical protein VE547_20380 [Mycobacteriales bacterium]|nr:hypothetical protein [Mycobacteriales bacterium]
MSVRSRLALAPWPVWIVLALGVYALLLWPLLRDPPPSMVSAVIPGVVVPLVARVLDNQLRREVSGWDRRQRVEVTERAERGELPGTEADRAALRRLVEHDLRQRRGFVWVTPVMFAAPIPVLVLREGAEAPLWAAAGTVWYVLLGALSTRLEWTDRTRRRAILAALDPA